MKKYILWISLTIFIFLGMAILIFDHKENFKISNIDLAIFRVETIDSINNCVILTTDLQLNSTEQSEYVIGFRIHTIRVSNSYDGLSSIFSKEVEDKGHEDTIINSKMISSEGNFSELFNNPSNIKGFKVRDSLITNHTIDNYNCLTSSANQTIDEFIHIYNLSKFDSPVLKDYRFFTISKKEVRKLLEKNSFLEFQLADGEIIKSNSLF